MRYNSLRLTTNESTNGLEQFIAYYTRVNGCATTEYVDSTPCDTRESTDYYTLRYDRVYGLLHMSTWLRYNSLQLTTHESTDALQQTMRISTPCDTTDSTAYYTWVHGCATTEYAVYYDWIHGCATNDTMACCKWVYVCTTTGSTAVLHLRLQLLYGWVYGCVTTEFTAGLQQNLRMLNLNVWLRYYWFYGSLASLECLQFYPSRRFEQAGCILKLCDTIQNPLCADRTALFNDCTALYRADCRSALMSRNLSEGFREFRHRVHANGGLVN
jgi:hypothetical protein